MVRGKFVNANITIAVNGAICGTMRHGY